MTKKDYIKIAELLNNLRQPFGTTEDELLDTAAYNFADMLADDNPRFDRARFLAAAGVK